jgi:hypothetical protein
MEGKISLKKQVFWGLMLCWVTLKLNTVQSLEPLEDVHPVIWCHIPVDFNHRQHCFENLKSCSMHLHLQMSKYGIKNRII